MFSTTAPKMTIKDNTNINQIPTRYYRIINILYIHPLLKLQLLAL